MTERPQGRHLYYHRDRINDLCFAAHRYFYLALGSVIQESHVKTHGDRYGGVAYSPIRWRWNAYAAGKFMEETAEMLKAINAELTESVATLQTLHDGVRATADIVVPLLAQQAEALRTARMTAVAEVQLSLNAMKEIRKFFLEGDYATEMARLERFIQVCRDLQALKAAGVLDAVSDIAVRLAVQEKSDA